MSLEKFREHIVEGYKTKGEFFTVGGAMFEGEAIEDAHVKIPLQTLNRHGLIAGATGTGKTKSLQVIAEQLSQNGVPVLLMDIKGDLSGIAKPSAGHPKIDERHKAIGLPFEPKGFLAELLTLSDEKGARMRATVSEFGPVLFSKMLDLSEAQQGIVAIIFKYCDDNKMPLIDLDDFKEVLRYITDDGMEEIEREYGRISPSSTGSILRKIIELETQGAERFFGEKSFDPEDLMRTDKDGNAQISIIRLVDIQDKPKLFSTFMLSLLAEIYSTFPEAGDLKKPKLALFIDEAHLIFKNSSNALIDQIEAIVKLIRSKSVGVFFVTQNPGDIPDAVLSQLGLKIQHALRAFTAKDRKEIKQTAENYPISDYYDTAEVLTSLGIGEALVTALNEKGRPTPLVATMMRAPQSRMDILNKQEIDDLVNNSELVEKYNEEINRESAYEILKAKLTEAQTEEHKKRVSNLHKKTQKEIDGKTQTTHTHTREVIIKEAAQPAPKPEPAKPIFAPKPVQKRVVVKKKEEEKEEEGKIGKFFGGIGKFLSSSGGQQLIRGILGVLAVRRGGYRGGRRMF